jgi:hypothetical protein
MNEIGNNEDHTDATAPVKALETPVNSGYERIKQGSDVYLFNKETNDYDKMTFMGSSVDGKQALVGDENGLGKYVDRSVLERDNQNFRMGEAKKLLGNKGADKIPQETKDLADAVSDLLKGDMN